MPRLAGICRAIMAMGLSSALYTTSYMQKNKEAVFYNGDFIAKNEVVDDPINMIGYFLI